MRRVALIVLVVLAATPGPRAIAQDPVQGIGDLLARRAEAMLDGNREAFMATIDRADPAFVERQELLFDGFQRLPLVDYRLDITTRYWPELTTARELEKYGEAEEPHVFHVEERYRLGGYDRQLALEDLYLTFVRRGDQWLVASDADLEDVTLWSGRKLWEFGPIVTRESEHFLYISHPDLAGVAVPVLDSAERALARVQESWPLDWPERVPIFAPSTTQELRRIIQATFDLDVFVAFAYSGVDRAVGWDLVGHRIILNWPNFGIYSDTTQESILTHELLHVATREYTGPLVPAFVDEGIAEWVSADADTYLVAGHVDAGTFDESLPRDFEFITGSDSDILNAYQESYTSSRFAADRFGQDALAEFYRLAGRVRTAPGTARYHVGRAMRAAFGISFARFEDRWAEWVEARY